MKSGYATACPNKLMLETRWYPMLVVGALFGAIGAIVKLFF